MKSIRLLALTTLSLGLLATTSCCTTCADKAAAHKAHKASKSECCGDCSEKPDDCCGECGGDKKESTES